MENEQQQPPPPSVIRKWYFDNYQSSKPDPPKNWVQLMDTECGEALDVYINGKKSLSFSGDIDQWGTWIGITTEERSSTVAQEWSTKSFMQALIAGLTEFSKICDFEGNLDKQKPEYVEEPLDKSVGT